jgi:hypothetical protein
MRTDWEEQWMLFDHKGTNITLHGHTPRAFSCTIVELCMLHESADSPVQLPPEVLLLLEQYKSVF